MLGADVARFIAFPIGVIFDIFLTAGRKSAGRGITSGDLLK